MQADGIVLHMTNAANRMYSVAIPIITIRAPAFVPILTCLQIQVNNHRMGIIITEESKI
jgi:hypothetical protein